MATDFECQVCIALVQQQSSSRSQEDITRANIFCNALKESDDGIEVCARMLVSSNIDVVQFWCLTVLRHRIQVGYVGMNEKNRELIKNVLILFLQKYCSNIAPTPFIKNALAAALIAVFKFEYLNTWPTFFTYLISMFHYGPQIVDIFLRTLIVFDQEIASNEIERDPHEHANNTDIKDAMRVSCIGNIVNAWYLILTTYIDSQPELVSSCLITMKGFIHWIDITCVVNDVFTPILMAFLSSPSFCAEACDCIFEIIDKRMPLNNKQSLLVEISIVDVLSNRITQPNLVTDETLASKLSFLISSLGIQIIDCRDVFVYDADMLLQNDSLLSKVLEISFSHASVHSFESTFDLIDFYMAYISFLKRSSDDQQLFHHFISHMLAFIFIKNQYPPWFTFHQQETDDEISFLSMRDRLSVLFKNLTRVFPDVTIDFVKNKLATFNQLSCFELESSLQLLFYIGEVMKSGDLFKPGGALASVIEMIISFKLDTYPHSEIVIHFLYVFVRFFRFLEHHPHHLLPIIYSFLGILSSNHAASIKSRATSQLLRLISLLNTSLKTSVAHDSILQSLTNFIIDSSQISVDDSIYLCETLSMLACPSVIGEKSFLYINPTISFFIKHLDAISNTKQSWFSAFEEEGDRISYNIAAICSLSKCFKSFSSSTHPQFLNLFSESIRVVVNIFLVLPNHESVRSKTLAFLSRMVVCAPDLLVKYVPTLLSELIKYTGLKNVREFLTFCALIVDRMPLNLVVGIIDIYFLKFIQCAVLCLSSLEIDDSNPESAYLADLRERSSVQKMLLGFLAVLVRKLPAVIVSENNKAHFNSFLEFVCQFLLETEPSVSRGAIQLWCALVESSCISSLDSFQWFFVNNTLPRALSIVLQPWFSTSNPMCLSLLIDWLALFKHATQLWGPEFLSRLYPAFSTALSVDTSVAQQFCSLLSQVSTENDVKQLRNSLKQMIQSRPK